MKPIVLVSWPRHVDIPLFRYNLKRFQSYFQEIYIGFTYHHEPEDYSNFIRKDLYFANFLDIERTDEDWRSECVNQLLDIIPPSDHILFLEQDFLIKDESFFDKLFEKDHDFLYYQENGRIHPAFAVVRRNLINETHRDFSPNPPLDHFGRFFEEISTQVKGETLEDYGMKWREDYYHMQGLTQNYKSFKYGDPFFRPATFFYFNWKSSLLPDQSPFSSVMEQVNLFKRPKEHEFLDKFFPKI
ncbi:MAG: hypothetical protein M1308_21980 [Actinobacteria bacterium]|nr:hypothetical protein [Actinomycetota bacterium]